MLLDKYHDPSWDHYSKERIAQLRRVVVWFSCGSTSAVAAKMTLAKYADSGVPIHICYCDTGSEHPDNHRFMRDCEQWFGQRVTVLKSDKYRDTWDVWKKTRWLVGVGGARCTIELKKAQRNKFQDAAGDIQVFGFDAGEKKRADRFRKNNPEVFLEVPLIDSGLTKPDCMALLKKAGIELPITYKMGYRNANCIPCVKGQQGYWNKIRRDFPEEFDRMARLEREIGAAINKTYAGDGKRKRVFLDELDPEAGRYSAEPDIECGVLCEETLDEIDDCDV